MTFMLPSVTAAPPSGKPAERSVAQHNTQQAEAPDSFGQALSRALKPEAEASDKPGAKTTTPAATKRQAAEDTTEPPALPGAAALALLPPAQDPVLPAALARAGLAGAANASASAISPASAPRPELAPADAAPADPGTPAALATPATPATPAAALMATSQAGQNLPPTRFNAAGADTALAPGHAATFRPAPAADAGASGTFSQADDQARQTPMMAPSAARAGAAAATAAAAAANPADETTALPVIPGQAPAADSANPNAALALGTVAAMPAGGAGAATAPAAAAPAAASASPLLAPEVGSSEWGKALGQQVVHLGQAGQQQAELQLNPPGLGPLKVTLSLNDQQLQAMFVSAHASVRAAVEAALPQLRASLADNGINLGNTSVSADNQQQAAFAQEQHRQPSQRAYANAAPPSIPANPAPRPLGEPLRQGHGLSVDTYA